MFHKLLNLLQIDLIFLQLHLASKFLAIRRHNYKKKVKNDTLSSKRSTTQKTTRLFTSA